MSNKELIERLINDDDLQLLSEAATALEAADKRVAELEAELQKPCECDRVPGLENRIASLEATNIGLNAIISQLESELSRIRAGQEPVANKPCICCANGNDLPDGEWCRACGRSRESALSRAVRLARGSNEPPPFPVAFSSRIVPDSECKQGKCASTTTGCLDHCRLDEMNPSVVLNAEAVELLTHPAAPRVPDEPQLCKQCGNPTMHAGDVCYGCAHPEYAALEREHLGDPEKRTGIYAGAAPLPDEVASMVKRLRCSAGLEDDDDQAINEAADLLERLAMEKDDWRIDYLEKHHSWHIEPSDHPDHEGETFIELCSIDGCRNDREYNLRGGGYSLREAIDAAIAQQKDGGK